MHYPVIKKDDFYGLLIAKLLSSFPEFKPSFEEDDGPYLILGEFYSFFIDRFKDQSLIIRVAKFVNLCLTKGGHRTEDVITIELFNPLYDEPRQVLDEISPLLNNKARTLLEKGHEEYIANSLLNNGGSE
ncbi:DUF7674 family protein [Roseivirga misakiensis]|uniref:DUF7674 domain-containing protein n=1 Tax=Roseivirga misakiensis TaxID=1563681 RepID=A0A1E5T339_9BACT|nr:hypothetical protein [Roseivirga misakiensis]OEK05790.1 hypothetical protein BFP71_06635 [Roseivirga misakiensis]